MLVVYRISNCSHHKSKVPGAAKKLCLEKALAAFSEADWIIVADNCDTETIEMCRQFKQTIITSLGNCGAFRKALDIACESSDLVYLAEDDYLYNGNNLTSILTQGLQRADYATFYSHPDKFEKQYDFGEVTKVIRIGDIYWKHTISTTMTFAAHSNILREDRDIWLKFTEEAIPQDHEAFCALADKSRTLICPIPGLACHMDLSDSEEEYLPNWAIDILSDQFQKLLGDQFPEFSYQETPIRRLKIMQALVDIGKQ